MTKKPAAKPAAPRDMPVYLCHKKVQAMKIGSIKRVKAPDQTTDDTWRLLPKDDSLAPITVDADYMRKHTPLPGGYFVRYEDGYQSFSPAKAFEDGYTLV